MAGVTLLRQILLLQRDVRSATRFYSEGLGLRVKVASDTWAELETGGTKITLKAAEGYRPLHLCLSGMQYSICLLNRSSSIFNPLTTFPCILPIHFESLSFM